MEQKINENSGLPKVGLVGIIVANMGNGKTPVVKELAMKSGVKNKIVYDPRHEYNINDFTVFHKFENFKKYVVEDATDSFIIFEEATGLVGSFKDLELTELIIAMEHRRNIIFFLFHSFNSIPRFMCDLVNVFICMPTNDTLEFIERNRPLFVPYWHKIQKSNSYNPVIIER